MSVCVCGCGRVLLAAALVKSSVEFKANKLETIKQTAYWAPPVVQLIKLCR